MGGVECPLNSALIGGHSFEVVIGLVEVPSSSGFQLLLRVVQLQIHVQHENGIKGVLRSPWTCPYRIDLPTFIGHADGIIVVFVDVPEGEVGLEGGIDSGDGLLEGTIRYYLFHEGVLLVLLHPFVLVWTKFS